MDLVVALAASLLWLVFLVAGFVLSPKQRCRRAGFSGSLATDESASRRVGPRVADVDNSKIKRRT